MDYFDLFREKPTDPITMWSGTRGNMRDRILALWNPNNFFLADPLFAQVQLVCRGLQLCKDETAMRQYLMTQKNNYDAAVKIRRTLSTNTRYYSTLVFSLQQLAEEQAVQCRKIYHATVSVRDHIEQPLRSLSLDDLKQRVLVEFYQYQQLSAQELDGDAKAIVAENLNTLFKKNVWLDRDVLDWYLQTLPNHSTTRIAPLSVFQYKIENGFYQQTEHAQEVKNLLLAPHCLMPLFFLQHYILLEIINNNNDASIYVYNSLPSINVQPVCDLVNTAILHLNPEKTISFHRPSVPLQDNSDDCGYFVAWFVELLLNNRKAELLSYAELSGEKESYFDISTICERMQFSLAGYRQQLPPYPLAPPLQEIRERKIYKGINT